MKQLKIVFTLVIISIFSLCAFTTTETTEHPLHGIWIYDGYEEGIQVMRKTKAFEQDQPGIKFNADGTLVKRQNAGWCGTPPISYTNARGTWEWENESVLKITYDYWGGKDTLQLAIISVDDSILKYSASRE